MNNEYENGQHSDCAPTIREEREELERATLSALASLSASSLGRQREEPECEIRTCYQRDIDRITHSKAFRRMKQKTQVFLQPKGDHYRTRLTHTLEVARIGRTVARALRLNEDLTEAIALGHDLGHTPFGHAGERSVDEILKSESGFKHNEQSLRIVDVLEKDGLGLNLTQEVRNGILCHTGENTPDTQEGKIVRIADRVAYLCHDLDDAIRAGVLAIGDIPQGILAALGGTHSQWLGTLVLDMITESGRRGDIAQSAEISPVFDEFYAFNYENVYKNKRAKGEESKVFGILHGLFSYYKENPGKLPEYYLKVAGRDGCSRAVCDYISGMTDQYAIYRYSELYIPEAWQGS